MTGGAATVSGNEIERAAWATGAGNACVAEPTSMLGLPVAGFPLRDADPRGAALRFEAEELCLGAAETRLVGGLATGLSLPARPSDASLSGVDGGGTVGDSDDATERAVFRSAESASPVAESGLAVSAQATPAVPIETAVPIPKATANAPTRPIAMALLVTRLFIAFDVANFSIFATTLVIRIFPRCPFRAHAK